MRAYRCAQLRRRADAAVETDVVMTVDATGIRAIEPAGSSSVAASVDVVDLPGLTLPGFVDAHSHLRSAAAGMQSHLPGFTFEQWAYALGALTSVPPYDDALVAADELLRTGVTGMQVILHSWGDLDARLAELDAAIAAIERVGLRALIILGFTDQAEYLPRSAGEHPGGVPLPHRGLPLNEWPALIAVAQERIAAASGRLTLGVGPVAPQWCSDEALQTLADHRGDLRVHTHLHESAAQRSWLGADEAPLGRLARFGLLGPFASVAHCVHLTEAEMHVLAETGASAVHCAGSNAHLGVGSAAVTEWLRAGMSTALGLDSQALPVADVFSEMRAVRRVAHSLGAPLDPEQILQLATVGGAQAMGSDAGELAVGAPADFIVLDPDFGEGGARIAAGHADAAETARALVEYGDRSSVTQVVIDGIQRFPAGEIEAGTRMRLSHELTTIVSEDADARVRRLRALADPLARVRELTGGAR